VKKHQPLYREFMGKVFNKIVQVLILWGIKDTQCGFKGFTAEAANAIFQKAKFDGFSFDVEVLYLARKLGYTIKEVPIIWYNDDRTTVSAFGDSLNMFLDIIRIKQAHR
jgi:dolichyl-phosphate beta-glucosyltransferase